MAFREEVQAALKAAEAASLVCRQTQTQLVMSDTVVKQDRSPVTIADFGSQAVVNLILKGAFPDDPILGEEDAAMLADHPELAEKVAGLMPEELGIGGRAALLEAIRLSRPEIGQPRRFWTVDPIDGTKGFLRGDQYAVAVALIEEGRPVVGVLGCPNFHSFAGGGEGVLVYAANGEGAFMQPLGGGVPAALQVSEGAAPEEIRCCESMESAHADHALHARIWEQVGVRGKPVRMDSQAKYLAVAGGWAEIYLRLPRDKHYAEKIWDHAAGSCIVMAAGGMVSDFSGRPLRFDTGGTLKGQRGICVTNGVIHDRVLAAIRNVTGC